MDTATGDDKPLKLAALDAHDLEVISAHLQDAVLKVGNMTYLPGQKRFALQLCRFDWLHHALEGGEHCRRRQAALSFDRVGSVRTQRIRRGADDAVLELLAVEFTEGESPGGYVDLIFAGGGTVRLEVECIEARLADLGPVWETGAVPSHDLSEAPEG
jgi:hypothetical protein